MSEITETKTYTDGELSSTTVTSDVPAPDFLQLARDVRAGREKLAACMTELSEATTALEQTEEFKQVSAVIEQKRQAQEFLSNCEARLREAAINQYRETLEKKFPGVSVRINRRLEYDRTVALQYVTDKLPALLSFDEKQFERFVLAVIDAGQPVTFVTVREEPTAAIATRIEV
jgi:hypothetical protein